MIIRFIQDEDMPEACELLLSEEASLSDDLTSKMDDNTIRGLLSQRAVIVAIDDRTVCGVFMLIMLNSTLAEFHSCIRREYRGKLAILIAEDVKQFIFRETPLIKIITHVPAYNLPAYALAKKVGMELIGLNKRSIVKNGKVYDQHIFGISKEGI